MYLSQHVNYYSFIKIIEVLMKTNTKKSTNVLSKWTRFVGIPLCAGLMLTLLVHAVAFSQYSNPAPVDLGTAGNFAILAKTQITTTGTTHITGDIGISPAAATFIQGFALTLPAASAFSTSALVTGKIYAPGYADPTPANLTTAVLNMGTAYTTAAGRAPNATELYAGNLTGQTLTRGVYKWGNGVTIGAGGVTISGSATDVWIFQIAQDLTLASGAIVHLSGGALASNIFWQVAGQVNLGTTAQMEGIILCQTQIAMTNGATLEGRALAQTAVTLIANIITQPATVVVTPPTVTSTDPVNAATGVGLNKQITATFSTGMDASTITASTFILMQGTTSVSGVVSYSGTTATYAPASNFLPNTLYTATITTGAKDIAGNALANNYVWSFTTAAVVTPPTVTSTDPVNAATSVALNKQIAATFSKTMDASTITASTFTLKQGATSVSGVVSYSGTTATFAPASNFLQNTLYTATITTGAKDVAGNALAISYVWSFTTSTAATAVDNGITPQEFSLSQNYPNPFNPSTMIQYSLGKAGIVSLRIYNLLGYEVATLVKGRQEAGSYTVPFGINNGTFSLSSGVYFYRLETGSFVATKKLILMK
jgi:hypothetical protein